MPANPPAFDAEKEYERLDNERCEHVYAPRKNVPKGRWQTKRDTTWKTACVQCMTEAFRNAHAAGRRDGIEEGAKVVSDYSDAQRQVVNFGHSDLWRMVLDIHGLKREPR